MLIKIGLILMAFFLGVSIILVRNMVSVETGLSIPFFTPKSDVIGFLPYWLIPQMKESSFEDITDLTYFGLTLSQDGTIQKRVNEIEEEPGWTTLRTGKVDTILNKMKDEGKKTSLLVFSADEEVVARIMDDPETHADNMMKEVAPIMQKRKFDDLNLDLESFNIASEESRQKFITFTKRVKEHIDKEQLGTLTIDISPSALIKAYLIDPYRIHMYVDRIVFMSYDYHYLGSSATGPVSPIGGAGINEEIDSTVFMKKAAARIPKKKILLGLALYGYEWETLSEQPRSAVIPGTGLIASSRRVEELLKKCATCSAQIDELSRESYVTYKNESTGAYHQIFYPDARIIREKIALSHELGLGGLALWALGYESSTILEPLQSF